LQYKNLLAGGWDKTDAMHVCLEKNEAGQTPGSFHNSGWKPD